MTEQLDAAAAVLRQKAHELFELEREVRHLLANKIPRAKAEYESARREYQAVLRGYAPLEPWGFESYPQFKAVSAQLDA